MLHTCQQKFDFLSTQTEPCNTTMNTPKAATTPQNTPIPSPRAESMHHRRRTIRLARRHERAAIKQAIHEVLHENDLPYDIEEEIEMRLRHSALRPRKLSFGGNDI